MSTANFQGETNGFPLYVHDDVYAKLCPECGAWNGEDDEECYECGEDLKSVDPRYDEIAMDDIVFCARKEMKTINNDLEFFEVGLESGYYVGVQFTVNFKTRWGCELDPEEMDNDDAHYYYDCCRSVMLRRYQRERRKLDKKLRELAAALDFEEIVCIGHFSNGEALYERAGTLRAAANAV